MERFGTVAINAAGGVTVCQDELSAKYSGMPMSAIETGCVDLVMSPEEIGAQLSKILKIPRDLEALKASPITLEGTAELVSLLAKPGPRSIFPPLQDRDIPAARRTAYGRKQNNQS
jgi:hypothetical protein